MKNTTIFLILFIALVSLTAQSYADSSVSVNTVVTSSSSTTSNSDCQTSVHIETNGQVQDYNSSDCNNVDVQSNNGNSTVHMTNNTGSNSLPPTSAVFKHMTTVITPDISREIQKIHQQIQKAKEKMKAQTKQQETMLQKIQAFLKNLVPWHLSLNL
jgi:hypothetical protein